MAKVSQREIAKRVIEAEWQRTAVEITLSVEGKSMGSTIPHGSRIRVKFSERPRLRAGTLVYLRRGDRRVVHRLLAVLGPVCMEKGDANRYPKLCWRGSILGTVTLAQSGDAPEAGGDLAAPVER